MGGVVAQGDPIGWTGSRLRKWVLGIGYWGPEIRNGDLTAVDFHPPGCTTEGCMGNCSEKRYWVLGIGY
jgi:hypothetical protein